MKYLHVLDTERLLVVWERVGIGQNREMRKKNILLARRPIYVVFPKEFK